MSTTFASVSETGMPTIPILRARWIGLQVATADALDEIVDRARKFAESDDRVEISERKAEDLKVVMLHSVYIRFLLPMRVELQCFEWAEGFDASRSA